MAARTIARVMLTLGFLAASVAYSSWTMTRTILDPSATRGATQALMATPTVRATLAREIRTALRPALGTTKDNPKLTAAIDAAVADPKFIGAFEDAIVSVHQGLLSGANGRVTLDTRAVTDSLDRAFTRFDPKTAARVRKMQLVSVPVGSAELPTVGDPRRKVTLVGRTALAIALALVGGALLLVHDRKMLRRAARRLAFLAVTPVLVFAVAPRVLDSMHKPSLTVGATMLEAFGGRVLFSAAILAVTGLSMLLMTYVIRPRASEERPTAPPIATGTPAAPDMRVPSRPGHAPVPEGLYL